MALPVAWCRPVFASMALALGLGLAAGAAWAQALVGRSLPIAGDCTPHEGAVIELDRYAFERVQCGRQQWLVLERFNGYANGLPTGTVVQAVALPAHAQTQFDVCYRGEAVLAAIVRMARDRRGQWRRSGLEQVWRFDTAAERIVPDQPRGLVCTGDGGAED